MKVTLLFVLTLVFSVSFGLDLCDFIQDLEDSLEALMVWDFIIVGSGASGSVVASRLAKETSKNVLLLEGGAKGTGQRDLGGTDYVMANFDPNPTTGDLELGKPWTRYDVPIMADSIRSASNVLKNTWNITAIGPFFSQAKVIGGNMATNGLAWNLPQKYDFDNWGIPAFNSTVMWPYMKKIENVLETGYGSANRGTSGPINVRFPTFLAQELNRFVAAGTLAGYSMGDDVNSGTLTPGIYKNQQSSLAGIRESTSTEYLLKALSRSNLRVRSSATVTKVLFDSAKNAKGVEYVNKNGVKRQVFALKEVILAAGDLQTAKILFNSGIGPASILNAFGIPKIVVNEIIGQKIRNHQRASITYSDPTIVNANFFSLPAITNQFASSGTGPMDRGGVTLSAKVDPTSPYPDVLITAGGLAGSTPSDAYAQRLSVTVSVAYNLYANGTLNLTSSDPLAPSKFTTNAFVMQEDAEKCAKGFIEARRIMSYWNGSAVEISPGPSVANNVTQLVAWIRNNAQTTCHYYGAVPMGSDPSAPCDTRWRVRGVQRLRIVGPSIVPGPVFLGMQALAVALGEKGTDLIKEDYGL